MTTLRNIDGVFILDTMDSFRESEDVYLDELSLFYNHSTLGHKVRVLSDDDYQAILSLLPKDCGYPKQIDDIYNPLKGLYKDVELLSKIRLLAQVYQGAPHSHHKSTKDFLDTLFSDKFLNLQ